MKIILQDTYKSLNPFESEELSDLSVITGKNGCGKSQLLDLINKNSKNDETVRGVRLEIQPDIFSVQAEGIIKDNVSQVNHDQWKQIVAKNLQAFRGISPHVFEYLKFIQNKGFSSVTHKKNPDSPLISNSIEYKELLSKVYAEITNQQLQDVSAISMGHQRKANNRFLTTENDKMISFVEYLCSHTGKEAAELTDADFYNSPIHEHLIDENDLFTSQVEIIFYNYAKRRDQNRKDYFYKKEEHEDNSSMPDIEFIELYPPP